MMEINRKNFPGLYWLRRSFVSLLVALFVLALVLPASNLQREPLSEKESALTFIWGLGTLWIFAVWVNVPKGIAWGLDVLWRIVVSILREAIQHIAHSTRAFVAAVKLVFWPVVAVFIVWKICAWVWRIF